MYMPGESAILEKIDLKFRTPVFAGDDLIYSAEVSRVLPPLKVVQLSLAITANDKQCVTGQCQCLVR
jgi:acyl dehydratase